MKSRFRLSRLLCIGTLALAACAPPTAPTTPPQVIVQTRVVRQTQIVEVPRVQVEIRLASWEMGARETDLIKSLLYDFSVANPDIMVRYEPLSVDYWATLNAMAGAGDLPDIFYMESFQFPGFIESGLLLPLDDLMADAGANRADFIPSLMEAFSRDGVTYGIPVQFDSLALFYNQDLFAEAGIPPPTDDWTWDDLRAAAEALSNPARGIYGLGVTGDPERFAIFAFQNGGAIMSDDFSDTLLDSPETVAAASFYAAFRKDHFGALPVDVEADGQASAFGSGKFAMVYDDIELIARLRDQYPDLNYGVVAPPAGPAGEGNLVFAVGFVLSQTSKHPAEAWQVVEFLTRESSQAQALESGLALPSRAALGQHTYFETHPASHVIFRGALEGGRPFAWGPAGVDVNDQIEQALERVYVYGQKVETSMKTAAEAVRTALPSK